MLVSLIVIFLMGCIPVASTSTPTAIPTENPDTAVVSPPEGEAPVDNPAPDYAPKPEDASLERGNVFLDEKGILNLESYPPQFMLSLVGSLPTPCHQLRASVAEPVDGKIDVDVYSISDPNMLCTEVLKPFSASVPLGTPPAGRYEVLVNGEKVGDLEWK
jgi:hypothetical protein